MDEEEDATEYEDEEEARGLRRVSLSLAVGEEGGMGLIVFSFSFVGEGGGRRF